ncbi:hypothetical protein EON81_17125 [bacterium]|nr:MAG: hypothetical protein EON81_17125 [bacterium]
MNRRQIAVFIATEAPVAAILRTDDFGNAQLLRWDMETDQVEFGQWITSRIDFASCDLSPNGRHFVASFVDERLERWKKTAETYHLARKANCRVWTAVSVVPYFTAVALWFDGIRQTRGALWDTDTRLLLKRSDLSEEAIAPPKELSVESVDSDEWNETLIQTQSMLRTGWRPLEDGSWEKRGNGVCLRRVWPRASIVHEEGWLVREWPAHTPGGVFLDFDHRGRVVFVDQRSVYVWEGCPEGKPRLIVDLNEAKFEIVPPPSDYVASF